MKLYQVRHIVYAPGARMTGGYQFRAFTNGAEARKQYNATKRECEANGARFSIYLQEVDTPSSITALDWIHYIEEGYFEGITFTTREHFTNKEDNQ